jgi:hypothetical protein
VQNKSWLHAHGFKTKGNAAKLRDCVTDAMDNGGDTVNLCTPSGGRTHDLNCVIQAWHTTVAWIMAHHVSPKLIDSVCQHISLFLDQLTGSKLVYTTKREQRAKRISLHHGFLCTISQVCLISPTF